MPDKTVRDEIAELTTAIHDLRDNEVAAELRSLRAEVERLRAERAHVCTCTHVVQTYPVPAPPVVPWEMPRVWCGTVTGGTVGTGGTSTMPGNYTVTAVN